MSKKNTALGAILGFFVFGIFYSTGFNKKGCFTFLGLLAASMILSMAAGPVSSCLANIAGAYLGYKWCNEHNLTADNSNINSLTQA